MAAAVAIRFPSSSPVSQPPEYRLASPPPCVSAFLKNADSSAFFRLHHCASLKRSSRKSQMPNRIYNMTYSRLNAATMMATLSNRLTVCVLDFDETITECDSSEWVAEQLGYGDLFQDLRGGGMQWHDAMNHVLHLLHASGTSISTIEQALWKIPLHNGIVRALKLAHQQGCELRILSDANTFFINAVLEHHGIKNIFTSIHSNPAWVDEEGCLVYRGLATVFDCQTDLAATLPNMPSHSCPYCPPNLCKGAVLDRIFAECAGQPFKVVYAGDGNGDYCPALRLRSQDVALPRKNYPLDLLLYHNAAIVAATVCPWTSIALTLEHTIYEGK